MATCSIPSNPDAGGIGIRVGVYVQSLLPFVLSHLDQLLGTTEDRRQTGRQTANLVILTGLALLISAIIQERTFGLTVYHGIIVLNLCWISVVGSAPLFFLGIRDRVSSPEAVFRKFAFSLFSIKLFVMGGYGIWLNTRILSFDTSPGNCTTSTMVWWFGYRVPVTSMQSRGPLLALYGLMVIPGFNAAIFTWLLLGFWFENWVSLILHILHIPRSFRAHIVSACRKFAPILYWAITVMAILHTEMTIAINTVQPGEAVWTLGQTFAALVALIPLGGLFERLVYAVFRERPNDDEDLLAMLWRRLTPTALPTNNEARRGFVAKLYQILLRMLKSFLNNMPTPITVRQRTQLLTRVKEARYLINMIPRDLGRRAEITALEELRNRVMFLEELLKPSRGSRFELPTEVLTEVEREINNIEARLRIILGHTAYRLESSYPPTPRSHVQELGSSSLSVNEPLLRSPSSIPLRDRITMPRPSILLRFIPWLPQSHGVSNS